MTHTYILIDASYFIFHRIHALYSWWRLSHPEEANLNMHENEEFVDKFRTTFMDKISQLPKKLGIEKNIKPIFIVGRDCPRENIWRLNIFPKYKGTRSDYKDKKEFQPGHFFKLVYGENLFQKAFEQCEYSGYMLKHESLEADDCLAITARELQKNKFNIIYIITSDTDYLQLKTEQTHLINMQFKTVNTPKNSLGLPCKDLLYKILVGDKSDNIPSTFPKCGPKTAKKYIDDVDLLKEDLERKHCYEQYKLNKRLIDFNEIPQSMAQTIRTKLIEYNLI